MRKHDANGDAAAPHSIDFDGHCAPVNPDMEQSVISVAPAGAAWSTADDMLKYLLLELRRGKTPDGHPLLSEETLQSRWRAGIKINDRAAYGLGLILLQEQGLEVMNHGGNTFGFTSDMYFLPQRNLGVVVLTNLRAANSFLGAIQQRIFEILFGAERKAEQMVTAIAKFQQETTQRWRDRVKIDSASVAWLDDYVGEYRSAELGPATITRKGGQFWAEFESWASALGAETQENGERLIVLISPPWSGTLRLQTSPDTGHLVIDGRTEQIHRCEQRVG